MKGKDQEEQMSRVAYREDRQEIGLWGRIKEKLGFVVYDDDDEDIEESSLFGNPQKPKREIYLRLEQRRMNAVSVHMSPQSVENAEAAIDNLKEGRQVVVNLERTDEYTARRIVDVVSGASYALDGFRQRIAEKVFLFTPKDLYIVVEDADDAPPLNYFDR